MRIIQINTADTGGGAERVAMNLHRGYRGAGHDALFYVGRNKNNELGVRQMKNDANRSRWARVCLSVEKQLIYQSHRVGDLPAVRAAVRHIGLPKKFMDDRAGREHFDYPATDDLAQYAEANADVLHLHNLHGDYFDLRKLPALSRSTPTFVTLHDMWMLTGHCSYSFACDRWQQGCGQCKHLNAYPEARRDATDHNWKVKRSIYAQSRLHIATPSQWLMDKVHQSMIAPSLVSTRVISNGVNLDIYCPGKMDKARSALGIDDNAHVLMFAANGIRNSLFKDYETLRSVIGRVGALMDDKPVVCVAVGDDAPSIQIGRARIDFVKHQADERVMAMYYRAADVYVHAARADNFPMTVIEALACGAAVVGSAVGGIVEQVDERVTGHLTPVGDAEAMAQRIAGLLRDSFRREKFSRNAASVARRRFGLRQQTAAYLDWQMSVLEPTTLRLRKAA